MDGISTERYPTLDIFRKHVRYKKKYSLGLNIHQAVQYFQDYASCECFTAGISSSRWIEDGYEI